MNPPSLSDRVRTAVWLLKQTEGEEVARMEALIQAAVAVLTGEP